MPLPERLTGDMPKRVRCLAPGPHYMQEGRVTMVYYDRLHTGSSYDQLSVDLDNGKAISGPCQLFEAVVEVEYVPGA